MISSSEKTSWSDFLGVRCLILSNLPESVLPTRCVGESGVINSGNCCSSWTNSRLSESRTASETLDLSRTK